MGWFAPVGMNIGGASHPTSSTGVLIGAEASVVYFPLPEGTWAGGYVDALYDSGSKKARMSIGPEFGMAFVGIDGGLVIQPGAGKMDLGYQARVLLTFGLFAVYGRWGKLPGLEVDSTFREIGVLLKFPILLRDDG